MSKQVDDVSFTYVGCLAGHNGVVTSVVVGQDSNGAPLVISGGRDKKVIVWNLNLSNTEENKETGEVHVGKPLRALSGHSHFVSGLALSKDSSFVVSSSWDKTLRLWDLNTFRTKALLKGHEKDVLCCALSHDGRLILSGSMDKTLRYWNIKGEHKFTENCFEGWVSSIALVKQNKNNLVAVGSWDQRVRLFGSGDQGFLRAIDGYDYGVVGTASDDEGEFLFSAEKNGKVRTHRIKDDSTEQKNEFDVDADVNAVTYDSKFYTTISIATSRGLKIHQVGKTSKLLFQWGVSSVVGSDNKKIEVVNSCHCLSFDEKREHLFAGFSDGTVRVFRFSSN